MRRERARACTALYTSALFHYCASRACASFFSLSLLFSSLRARGRPDSLVCPLVDDDIFLFDGGGERERRMEYPGQHPCGYEECLFCYLLCVTLEKFFDMSGRVLVTWILKCAWCVFVFGENCVFIDRTLVLKSS